MFNTIKKITNIFKRSLNPFPPFLFDLGTSTIRIGVPNKGIIRTASFIAYHLYKKEYLFYGNETKQLIGKLPKQIEIIAPIKKGVVNDFDALAALLSFVFEEEILKNWPEFKMKIPFSHAITAIPYFATEIEQRASLEVLKKINFNKVFGVFNLVATGNAIFENFLEASPAIILDIGAGKTEAGIISRGGIVVYKNSDIAGEYLDEKVKNYLYIKYGIIIGKNTAENLKEELLFFDQKEKYKTIKGKAIDTGLPKQIKVSSTEIREALIPYLYQIVDLVKELIEESPPEILEEIIKNGLYLTGGLAKTQNLDIFIKEELKIKISIQKEENIVIEGLKRISSSPQKLFYFTI